MDKIQLQKLKVLGLGTIVVLSTIGFFAVNTTTQANTLDLSQTAQAALIMKIDGVDGESTYKDGDKGSDILSFSWGVTQPGGGATGATRRRGSAILSDIFVLKEMDKSTPKIFEAASKGVVYPMVKITSFAIGGGFNYQFELRNVMITSVQLVGGEGVPLESISLNYEEVKFTYVERDQTGASKGNVEYSWKVEEGEG
ncbi:MAG: Hcp family type VI secretion system effector [Candidatus Kariarchaeaceae archaeon]|jgi:type VI secretion system secreted protein Hcp